MRTRLRTLIGHALLMGLCLNTASAHPLSASHLWPDVCKPMEFDEFLAVAKTSGTPVSLGPKGFYIHFGNARCLFLRAETGESHGSEDKYSYYHQKFVDAL